MAWEALENIGRREISELELFGTKSKNAEMSYEYNCAIVAGLTGLELRCRLYDLLIDKTIEIRAPLETRQ
jgi:hypothetical protein